MVVEKVFAVIAESTRRDILEALAQDSKAVGQLVDELGVSQPTVSKHLRVLREAGVVTMRAQGQKRFYGINTEPLALVSTWLDSLGAGVTENSGSPGAAAARGAGTVADVPAPASGSGKEAAEKPAAAAALVAVSAAATSGARPVTKTPTAANRTELPATPAAVRTEFAVSAAGSATASASVAEASSRAAAARTKPEVTSSPGAISSSTAATSAAVAPGEPAAETAPKQSNAAFVKQPAIAGVGNDGDGGVPRQLGRSVGRAAKKGADLLATFKRRKD